jgi:hypothetical protein
VVAPGNQGGGRVLSRGNATKELGRAGKVSFATKVGYEKLLVTFTIITIPFFVLRIIC